MATAKSTKVQNEIEKARAKLAEQQARIKELESKHTELENMEIVDIVRGLKIPLDDLAAVLQSVKGGAVPSPVPTSGQVGPKSKTAKPDIDDIGDDDDKEDESE